MIPNYIQALMSRASFYFASGTAVPGYTISIRKQSDYSHVQTLKEEIEQLAKWVRKECRRLGMDKKGAEDTIVIERLPSITLYSQQHAYVTIYDPIMRMLEKYIPE